MTLPRFRWLHFTDLHVGMAASAHLWPNVEEEILADLDRIHAHLGGVDVIFFTGDLTQRGTLEEFDKFDQIFGLVRRRLAALGSSPAFVAVPGNHDLVRPPSDNAVMQELKEWTKSSPLRERFWTDPYWAARTTVAAAFGPWTAWSDRTITWDRFLDVNKSGLLPGDFRATWVGDGIRIGLLGLNTAALQLNSGDYREKLSLDSRQTTALVEKLYDWVAEHDACLVLTHHDPSWLDRDGRAAWNDEIARPGRFAVHLCGHRHEQGRTTISEGGAPPRRTIIGRSLFGLEEYEEEGNRKVRLHGYSGGFIEIGTFRAMRLWPRRDETQHAGHRVLRSDQSEVLEADEGTPVEDLGPSPRTPREVAVAEPQVLNRGDLGSLVSSSEQIAGAPTEKDVITELAEHYADRDQIRDLWLRSGGRSSDVPHMNRVRDLWRELFRLASSGALANPRDLVEHALEDLPSNTVLLRYLGQDAPARAPKPAK